MYPLLSDRNWSSEAEQKESEGDAAEATPKLDVAAAEVGVATERRIIGGVDTLPSTPPNMASASSEITPTPLMSDGVDAARAASIVVVAGGTAIIGEAAAIEDVVSVNAIDLEEEELSTDVVRGGGTLIGVVSCCCCC